MLAHRVHKALLVMLAHRVHKAHLVLKAILDLQAALVHKVRRVRRGHRAQHQKLLVHKGYKATLVHKDLKVHKARKVFKD
jgi:hypothetical protein